MAAYEKSEQHQDIARLVDLKEIKENLYNLSIPLYVAAGKEEGETQNLESAIEDWKISHTLLKKQTNKLFASLRELGYEA